MATASNLSSDQARQLNPRAYAAYRKQQTYQDALDYAVWAGERAAAALAARNDPNPSKEKLLGLGQRYLVAVDSPAIFAAFCRTARLEYSEARHEAIDGLALPGHGPRPGRKLHQREREAERQRKRARKLFPEPVADEWGSWRTRLDQLLAQCQQTLAAA